MINEFNEESGELNKYLMPKTNADSEENLQPGELDQCGTVDSSSGYVEPELLVKMQS